MKKLSNKNLNWSCGGLKSTSFVPGKKKAKDRTLKNSSAIKAVEKNSPENRAILSTGIGPDSSV